MDEKVRVSENIEMCVDDLNHMILELESFETVYERISTLLTQEDKWAGNRQKLCVKIHTLIGEYERDLRPICEMLKVEIENLINSVEGFAGESALLKCLGEYHYD